LPWGLDSWVVGSTVTSVDVDVIQAADRKRAVATLALAFAADPLTRWTWPDTYQYATYWPKFVEAFAGGAFDHGTAHGLEDCRAVALWLSPGHGPDEETLMAVARESMDDQVFEDTIGLFEQMDAVHPRVDHWYLPVTGVDPVAQGQRLGSTLMAHALAICDSEGLPAYLEATNPRSRNLYARLGFDVIEVIQYGTSPPVWAMLRPPRS
jgi:GNAT superfamily N-acetyltransferase